MSSTIGQRIAALRKSKGLTQQELADALEIGRRTLVTYEGEDGKLPSDVILKMVAFFEVSSDYLLGVSHYHNSVERNRLLKERCLITEQFNERDQALVIDLIESLMHKYPDLK